jgi:hypothetical protein
VIIVAGWLAVAPEARGAGPSDDQAAQILDAAVARYRISAVDAP